LSGAADLVSFGVIIEFFVSVRYRKERMTELDSDLERALAKIHSHVHEPLALAHVTVGRYLGQIIERGCLVPRHCQIFDDHLIYLSYGAPYYKPTARQTEDALEFPVILILDTQIRALMDFYYPFDTEAVHAGIFGDRWRKDLGEFARFRIVDQPERIISALYGSNRAYLRGRVLRKAAKYDPLPLLRSFLSQDLADAGVDQRQRENSGVLLDPTAFGNTSW
jgi:hypothetical protein